MFFPTLFMTFPRSFLLWPLNHRDPPGEPQHRVQVGSSGVVGVGDYFHAEKLAVDARKEEIGDIATGADWGGREGTAARGRVSRSFSHWVTCAGCWCVFHVCGGVSLCVS